MAAAIHAMLRESTRPWTVNDQSVNEHTRPAADLLEITASLEQQQHGRWVETTLIGPPEIRVNCRVEQDQNMHPVTAAIALAKLANETATALPGCGPCR
jgi:hypothetical protein